jgi:hypothetical protein
MVVHGVQLNAVLDTASQVTVMSEELYRSLKAPPPVVQEVVLSGAAKDGHMAARIVGPVMIQCGPASLSHLLYVAPISDPMLLGINLLAKLKAKIDLVANQLTVGDSTLPLLVRQYRKCVARPQFRYHLSAS